MASPITLPARMTSARLYQPQVTRGFGHTTNGCNPDVQSMGFERGTHEETPIFFPLELWLKIFGYLQPADLRASTLTCSPFRWLAQPLLFTVLDISPFFLAYNVDRRILRPRKYLDRTVERLRFYRSAHIAPAVTRCWISPYSRTGFPPRNSRDYLDPALIIDAVINTLPIFPNLRILSWHCINFTAKWWDSIQRLPIDTLWVNSCTVDGSPSSPLSIQHLDLDQWAWEGVVTNHPSIHEEHSSGVSQEILSLVLNKEHIQHVSVPRVDTCARVLSRMAAMDSFSSLRTLQIPFSAIFSSDFIETLINSPRLKELRIFTPLDEKSQVEVKIKYLPPSALLSLSVYEGPYVLLPFIGLGRPLRDVSIWGLDESPGLCDPSLLVSSLYELSHLNTTLEVIQVFVSYITVELLTAVSSFPLLKSLAVTSGDNPRSTDPEHKRSSASHVTPLYITLRNIQLPPQIENLRLTTKLNHGNLDTPTQEQEASRLIEFLAFNHSKLQSVEIGYGTYWTGTCIARWKRFAHRSSTSESLGSLVFEEWRRNIVYPDVQRTPADIGQWSESEGPRRVLMWARRLLQRYVRIP